MIIVLFKIVLIALCVLGLMSIYKSYYINPKVESKEIYKNWFSWNFRMLTCVSGFLGLVIFGKYFILSNYLEPSFFIEKSGDLNYWLGLLVFGIPVFLCCGIVMRIGFAIYFKLFATEIQKNNYSEFKKTENQTIIKYQKEEEGEERIQRRKDLKKAYKDKESAKQTAKPKNEESDDAGDVMIEMLRRQSKEKGIPDEAIEKTLKKTFPENYKPPKD